MRTLIGRCARGPAQPRPRRPLGGNGAARLPGKRERCHRCVLSRVFSSRPTLLSPVLPKIEKKASFRLTRDVVCIPGFAI